MYHLIMLVYTYNCRLKKKKFNDDWATVYQFFLSSCFFLGVFLGGVKVGKKGKKSFYVFYFERTKTGGRKESKKN